MTEPTTKPEQPAHRPPASVWVVGCKIALIVAIGWLGVSNARALIAWSAGAAAPGVDLSGDGDSLPRLPDVPAEATQVMGMLQEGDWQFAGATWRLGVASVDTDALERRLEEEPPAAEQSLGLDPRTSRSLLNALRLQGGQVTRLGDVNRIAVSNPRSKIVAYYCSTAEGDVVLSGRMAWPDEGDTWKVITGRPAPAGSGGGTTGSSRGVSMAGARREESPPSMPVGATLMATRRSPEGAVLGQVYEAASARPLLIDHWRREGWRVQSLAGTQAGAPTGRFPAVTGRNIESNTLLLSRGELSYAATVRDGGAGPTVVLLARCGP